MKNKLIKLFHSPVHQSLNRPLDESTTHSSESGFMFIAIILILLVAFSFTMVSGAKKFEYSPEKVPGTSATPTPSAGTITPTPNQSAGWSITYVINSCENGIAKGTISNKGTANGYGTLEQQDSSGNYQIKSSDQFVAPEGPLDLTLRSADGYNSTPWRLGLYEGGSGTRDNFSGGTLRATIQGTPTSCP